MVFSLKSLYLKNKKNDFLQKLHRYEEKCVCNEIPMMFYFMVSFIDP
jgi:hypothetical protein